VTTGGWYCVEVLFHGWLDEIVAVKGAGVVLPYTGFDVLLTGVEYQGDDSTSFTIVLDAVSEEGTGTESETSFLCIPRTKGSGRP
jgi:hypothetical protein